MYTFYMAEKGKGDFQNILDYLDWRGDLTFDQNAFNDVDALIFCQLSYLHFDSLVSSDFDNFSTLFEVSEKFKDSSGFETRKNLGVMINPLTTELLFKCASSRRFCGVKLCGFVDDYDKAREKQFSAVTFLFDEKKEAKYGFSGRTKKAFVAFRGTDDTLVGWKEDFNLAFMESVPAQEDAASYLFNAMNSKSLKKYRFYAGGHSKGGNLAIYSAANLDEKSKERILNIYNFDGPGFSEKDLESGKFLSIKPKIVSVFPQMSMIGMLFHHYDDFKVVFSSEKLVMQHDPFSWLVLGADFVLKDSLENGSEIFFRSFNIWFENLEKKQRENFVETVFSLLDSTKARTNTELSRKLVRNAGAILKAAIRLDSSIRDDAIRIIKQFLKITGEQIVLSLK